MEHLKTESITIQLSVLNNPCARFHRRNAKFDIWYLVPLRGRTLKMVTLTVLEMPNGNGKLNGRYLQLWFAYL